MSSKDVCESDGCLQMKYHPVMKYMYVYIQGAKKSTNTLGQKLNTIDKI